VFKSDKVKASRSCQCQLPIFFYWKT